MTQATLPNTDTRSGLADTPSPGRPKVLYIGGQGRSGSTVLGRLLGELDGFVHVGEAALIWGQRDRGRLCGCGEAFASCPFWREVAEMAFGGFDQVDLAGLLQTKRRLDSYRAIPALLAGGGLLKTEEARRYFEALDALYVAIGRVSGAKVIVDGSKSPVFSYVLDRVGTIELYSLHLVRDSRAVAHSNRRQKSEPLTNGGTIELGKLGPWRTAAEWNLHNTLMQMRARRGSGYMRTRYEDIVRDTRGSLDKIASFVGAPQPELGFLDEEPVRIGAQHTIGGNPDRFNPAVSIRLDAEWRRAMGAPSRRIVTFMTLPLLAWYGYLADRAAQDAQAKVRKSD